MPSESPGRPRYAMLLSIHASTSRSPAATSGCAARLPLPLLAPVLARAGPLIPRDATPPRLPELPAIPCPCGSGSPQPLERLAHRPPEVRGEVFFQQGLQLGPEGA